MFLRRMAQDHRARGELGYDARHCGAQAFDEAKYPDLERPVAAHRAPTASTAAPIGMRR